MNWLNNMTDAERIEALNAHINYLDDHIRGEKDAAPHERSELRQAKLDCISELGKIVGKYPLDRPKEV